MQDEPRSSTIIAVPLAQSALQEDDAVSPLLTHNAVVLKGNGLQHELLGEIVTHVERWAQVDLAPATVPLQAAFYRDSILLLGHAHNTKMCELFNRNR